MRLSLRNYLFLLLPIAISWIGAAGCRADADRANDIIIKNIPYIADPADRSQQLDLRAPPHASKVPVIVMIHGGGWAVGDKDNANCGVTSDKAKFFLRHGMIFATVNYRLSPGAHHPDHVHDIAAAITYLHNHVATYGGNPEQIYLMGHSAGAHLAALVTLDRRYLAQLHTPATCLRGVILLDGAGYDIPVEYVQLQQNGPKFLFHWYTNAFTAATNVQRDASPRWQVTPGYLPPFLMFYTARANAPLQNHHLAETIRRQGGQAQTILAENKTHMTLNRNIGKADDEVTPIIAAFIAAHP